MARPPDRNIHRPHPPARRTMRCRDDADGANARERARTARSFSRRRFLSRASPSLFPLSDFGRLVEPMEKAIWISGPKRISETLDIVSPVPIKVARQVRDRDPVVEIVIGVRPFFRLVIPSLFEQLEITREDISGGSELGHR